MSSIAVRCTETQRLMDSLRIEVGAFRAMTKRWFGLVVLLVLAAIQLLVPAAPARAADSDCIENGGKAICTRPILGRPQLGACVKNALSTTEAAISFCATQVPGPYYDEGRVKEFIDCLPRRQNSACHVDPLTIEWASEGAHHQDPVLCWSITATERLGWGLVHPTYKVQDQNGACSVSGGYYEIVVRRDTPVECPRGFQLRNTASGDAECWRMPTPCGKCDDPSRETRGNPIEIISLKKLQTETDYRSPIPGGLEFTRTYHSFAYYRPLKGYVAAADTGGGSGGGSAVAAKSGIVNKPFGEYWTHTYERRVFPVPSNPFVAATLLGPQGDIRYFKVDGTEFFNDGSGDRLIAVAGGWNFISGRGVVEAYDSDGTLQTINDHGRVTTLIYSDANTSPLIAPRAGYLISVTDWTSRQLNLRYDGEGRLVELVTPGGATTSYEFNGPSAIVTGDQTYSFRMVTKVTYPDATSRTYHYNEQDRTQNARLLYALTGLTDEAGVRYASWNYDAGGAAIRSEHAGGVERVNVSTGSPRTVTDALGNVTTYSFQQIAGVWRTTGKQNPCVGSPCAPAEIYAYDGATGDPTSRTDPKGVVTTYVYDPSRHIETSRTEADATARARTIGTQYHNELALPTQIDEPGRRTTYTYDANGNILTRSVTDLTVTPNVTRTWTYTYGTNARVLTEDGPRTDASDVTTFTYHDCPVASPACGLLETVTNALGHTTTYNSYNAHGQPLTITDANGVLTTLTYDARQRLTSRSVGTEQWSLEYWPTGLLKKATLPDGSTLQYIYDDAHRLATIEDSEGNRVVYTRDLMSNVTKEEVFDPSNALTRTRTQVFDAMLRLQKQIGSAGTAAVTTTFGYDHNSNQASISAPLARNTAQTYDEHNRLSTVTDPLSGLTQYSYNALDQLLSVTDPRNLVTSYEYNAFGDLTRQTSPDTGVTVNTYDAAGNLATSIDARNKTTTYQYDALNRVTQRSDGQEVVTFVYDQNRIGHLSSISDSSGSTTWTYTPEGRVASRTQTMGSVVKSVGYDYNSAGQLATMTTPSGRSIAYSYANGRIAGVTVGTTSVLSQVLYEPFGATRGWTWSNGSLAVRTYDTDGKLTQLDSAGARSYGYDDAFRITSITDPQNAAQSWTYGYDKLDRLTSAMQTATSQGFTYDANGNRLTMTGSTPATYSISSTSNRLSAVTGAVGGTYGYDESGNLLSRDNASFTYNNAGRMTSSTRGSVTTTYAYNALGQRVRKSSSVGTTYFVYDEAGRLVGEYDADGDMIQETVWMGDIPIATLRWGECGLAIFYIHTDHLNTPRRITKRSAPDVVWQWESDPFGATEANEDPSGAGTFVYNLRFPGQYYDEESGLHYNYLRDYDPSTGWYAQSDPIGLLAGNNTYAYVGSSPIAFSDASGLLRGNPADWLPVAQRAGSRVPLGAAFLAGIAIGTEIYNEFGDDIQDALEKTCPPRGTNHRGRMQAQGHSGGPNVNVSSNWAQPFPLMKGEAFLVLHKTVIRIPQRQLPRFVDAIGRAASFISGTSPQTAWFSKSFYSNPTQGRLRGADRIDIEVWAGQAF